MNRLSTALASVGRGLNRHGAPRAIVAAMNAHFDVPAVVKYTTAALAAITADAASLSPGMPWGTVVGDGSIGSFPPGSREEDCEEAAGGAAADDDDAALARA
jgi:hypothetical protein